MGLTSSTEVKDTEILADKPATTAAFEAKVKEADAKAEAEALVDEEAATSHSSDEETAVPSKPTSVKDGVVSTSMGELRFKFNITKVPFKDTYASSLRDVLVWADRDGASSVLNALYNSKYEHANLMRDGDKIWLKIILRESGETPEYSVSYS